MKSVVVVKMKEGYLILPYDASILSAAFIQGRAIERSGYDSSKLGKAIEDTFREEEERIVAIPPPISSIPKNTKEDADVPF